MTESEPETTRMFWVPEITDGIDLTDAMEIVQTAAAAEHITMRTEEPPDLRIPEETLTKVYSSDGYLMAYVEAFHGDEVDTLRFYPTEHPPGAPRMVLPPDIANED